MNFKVISVATAFSALLFSGVAQAQEQKSDSAPVTVSGEIGVVSDYPTLLHCYVKISA